MFGLDITLLLPLFTAFGGFMMKMMANNQQLLRDKIEADVRISEVQNLNYDSAYKRNKTPPSFLQRFVAIAIIGFVMIGLVVYGYFGDISTTIETITPTKTWFFGLFETGGKAKLLSTNGFLIPDFVKHSFLSIIGYLFGASCAKLR